MIKLNAKKIMSGFIVRIVIITAAFIKIAAVYRYGSLAKGAAFPCRCTDGCDPDDGTCTSGECQTESPGYKWGGDACRIGNVALGMTAYQIGTYENQSAGRAVDGQVGPGMNSGQCAFVFSPGYNRAWWYVDLTTVHVIYNVTLYNIDHYYFETLSDFQIYVGNDSNVSFNPVCHTKGRPPIPIGGSQAFECATPMYGRYIGLRRKKNKAGRYETNYATICEFVAIGRSVVDCGRCPSTSICDDYHGCSRCRNGTILPDCFKECEPGRYGVNCEGTCSSGCKFPSACDLINGTCLMGCHDISDYVNDAWWFGEKCDIHIVSLDVSSVTNLTISEITKTSVIVKWTDALNVSDVAAHYFGYYVYYRGENQTHWTMEGQAAYTRNRWKQFELKNLFPDQTILIKVSVFRRTPHGMVHIKAMSEDANSLLTVKTSADILDFEHIWSVAGVVTSALLFVLLITVITTLTKRRSKNQLDAEKEQPYSDRGTTNAEIMDQWTNPNDIYLTFRPWEAPGSLNEYATFALDCDNSTDLHEILPDEFGPAVKADIITEI